MGETVHLSRSLAGEIISRAAQSDQEVCGLLLGCAGHVTQLVVCRNVHPTPATHFELDPAALFAALRAARAGGPAVIGHYHSHPSGQATPSATDAAAAAADGSIWIIVAGTDITAWKAVRDGAVHGRFDPLALAIAR